MKDQKIKLRRELIEGRRAIPKEERLAVDGELAEIFLSLPEYKNADTVLLYASYGAEIDTYKISKAAAADKKRIAYPRCEKNGIMRFFLCRPENLLPGFRSIPEPPDSAEPWDGEGSTICVVPALAVDKKGYRIGYGGGYYDRFLKDFRGTAVGLIRSGYLFESVPCEEFDLKVNITVTEKEVIYNEI